MRLILGLCGFLLFAGAALASPEYWLPPLVRELSPLVSRLGSGDGLDVVKRTIAKQEAILAPIYSPAAQEVRGKLAEISAALQPGPRYRAYQRLVSLLEPLSWTANGFQRESVVLSILNATEYLQFEFLQSDPLALQRSAVAMSTLESRLDEVPGDAAAWLKARVQSAIVLMDQGNHNEAARQLLRLLGETAPCGSFSRPQIETWISQLDGAAAAQQAPEVRRLLATELAHEATAQFPEAKRLLARYRLALTELDRGNLNGARGILARCLSPGEFTF